MMQLVFTYSLLQLRHDLGGNWREHCGETASFNARISHRTIHRGETACICQRV